MIRTGYRALSAATGLRAIARGPFALLRWFFRRVIMRHLP